MLEVMNLEYIEDYARRIFQYAEMKEVDSSKQKGFLAGAERKGQIVEGFDFGNSPFSFMKEEFRGQEVVLTTTNGTKSLEGVQEFVNQ